MLSSNEREITMSKTKRKIIIDGQDWLWSVTGRQFNRTLGVYCAQTKEYYKKELDKTEDSSYGQGWYHVETMTPKKVREFILESRG